MDFVEKGMTRFQTDKSPPFFFQLSRRKGGRANSEDCHTTYIEAPYGPKIKIKIKIKQVKASARFFPSENTQAGHRWLNQL